MLTSFSIEREVIIDIISDYIEAKQDNDFFNSTLEDEIWNESLQDSNTARDRASFVLRKLENHGWIIVETYSNYQQYINLNDYSIKILDTLDKVRKNYQAEYQGYVYATYTLLYSEEAKKKPQDILKLHFEDYKKEIIDRSYHRLKTSDNV